MLPHSLLRSGEIKKDRSQKKCRIRKSNRRREITVEDKSHHTVLERVRIQIMSIQAVGSSIAHHASLEHFLTQIMSMRSAELSRAHHATLERVFIRN